jgi:hypothetical protein
MTSWYYGSQGQQNGPIPESELRRLLADGTLTQQTLVWRDGLVEWKPVAEVAELQAPPLTAPAAFAYQQAAYGVVPQCGLAVASMVCGIVSLMACYVHAFAAIPAVICGHLAIKKIRESEQPMAGRGMAIAGLVTGYLGLLIQLTIIVGAVFFFRKVVAPSSAFP